MSKENFELKLPALEAIEHNKLKNPNMPVAIALQEAEDLYEWCISDKDLLLRAGLDSALIDDLTNRIGACRYIQSKWQKKLLTQEDSQKEWKKQSSAAFKLRDELLHHFSFAYRNSAHLTLKVKKIAHGSGNAEMIQNLNDLSVLGKANPVPLQKIDLDPALLEKAAVLSDQMGELLAKANGERLSENEIKLLRNKAYTHMKQAVDEIRRTGQYVFWQDNERKKGYKSKYFRRRPQSQKKANVEKQ
jgi:hypothetical protein